jgi:hypothetical protein
MPRSPTVQTPSRCRSSRTRRVPPERSRTNR